MGVLERSRGKGALSKRETACQGPGAQRGPQWAFDQVLLIFQGRKADSLVSEAGRAGMVVGDPEGPAFQSV